MSLIRHGQPGLWLMLSDVGCVPGFSILLPTDWWHIPLHMCSTVCRVSSLCAHLELAVVRSD
eukprot:358192-Chlamydomonas_euryale.AAC.6